MDPEAATIIGAYPVFDLEEKITDNLFRIRLNADSMPLAVRLYPFAVFEVPEDADILTLGEAFDLREIKPFSYVQPLLVLTTQCNFRCTYCYAHEGTYGFAPQIMSQRVLDRSVDYLRHVISTRYARHAQRFETTELGLICFGGEPTIAMPLVRDAYAKLCGLCDELTKQTGSSFKPTLTVNTNGYQLRDETLDFLVANMADIEVVVSYDGVLHDECRRNAAGEPTAERVMQNIRILRAHGINVAVTCCVLPQITASPELFVEGLAPIYEEGIAVNPSFIRGPLESVSNRAIFPGFVQKSYRSPDLNRFGDIIAAEIRKGAPIYSRRYRRRLMEGGYRYRCGAGLYEFAVMPDGSVYPCHNFVAKSSQLGNVLEDDFRLPESHYLLQALLNRCVKRLSPCSGCVFQSSCMSSFDCPAHSLHDLGDLNTVDSRFCGFARKVQSAILTDFITEMQHAKQ